MRQAPHLQIEERKRQHLPAKQGASHTRLIWRQSERKGTPCRGGQFHQRLAQTNASAAISASAPQPNPADQRHKFERR
jgi:hypothetical protein